MQYLLTQHMCNKSDCDGNFLERIRHIFVTISLGPPFANVSRSILRKCNDASCANHLGGSMVNCPGPEVPGTQILKRQEAGATFEVALSKQKQLRYLTVRDQCLTGFCSRSPVSDVNSRWTIGHVPFRRKEDVWKTF